MIVDPSHLSGMFDFNEYERSYAGLPLVFFRVELGDNG